MPFGNPVVGGSVLIRPAIQSPNYSAGVAGWTINADGSAEFNDVVLRGELLVSDADGSYVRIYDQSPGTGASIDMKPADNASIGTITPASAFTDTAVSLPNKAVFLFVTGPSFSAITAAEISLSSQTDGVTNESRFDATAKNIGLTATGTIDLDGVIVNANGLVIPGATKVLNQLQSANDSIAVSTTWTTMVGVNTLAFTKQYSAAVSKLVATISVTSQATAAATRLQFGVRDGTTDWFVAQFTHPAVNDRRGCSGTADITGLASGGYTFTPRWQRAAGAGTGQRFATDDQYCLTISEVPV
jgi:hypothetical protein